MRNYTNWGYVALWILLSFLAACIQQGEVAQAPGIDEPIEVDNPPQPLNMREIQTEVGYPEQARAEGIEGMVVARILVDEEGNYERHEWVKGEPAILAQAVDEQIAQLSFKPAAKNGKPVKFWVNLPFNFKLMDGQGSEKDTLVVQDFDQAPQPQNLMDVYQQIQYPESLKEQGQEGRVIVRMQVSAEGEYLKHEVVQSDYPALTTAVEAVLGEIRFEPAQYEGKPVKGWVAIPFMFKLGQ